MAQLYSTFNFLEHLLSRHTWISGVAAENSPAGEKVGKWEMNFKLRTAHLIHIMSSSRSNHETLVAYETHGLSPSRSMGLFQRFFLGL